MSSSPYTESNKSKYVIWKKFPCQYWQNDSSKNIYEQISQEMCRK